MTAGGGFPNQNNYVPIDPTKKYRVQFWARPVGGCDGLLYFSLRQFNDNQGTASQYNGGRSPYKPAGISHSAHNYNYGADAWGLYDFVWDASDWQPGMKYVQPEFLGNYSGSTGYWEIQGYTFTDASATESLYSAIQTEATTRASQTGDLYAQYTVKLDVNGKVSGFGLASTGPLGPGSLFEIRADKFAIVAPSGYGESPYPAFSVITAPTIVGGVTFQPGAYATQAFIFDAQITNAKIQNAAIDDAKIANLSAAKITTGTLDAARIATGSLDAKIANLDAAVIGSGYINAARINNASIANVSIGSAQIIDAAISSAKIADAAITSAKIGSLAVGTVNIAGNAVTVPVYAELTSIMTIVTVGTQTIISASIDSGGGPILICYSLNVVIGNSGTVLNYPVEIRVGSTVVKTHTLTRASSSVGASFNFNGVAYCPAPAAGSQLVQIYLNAGAMGNTVYFYPTGSAYSMGTYFYALGTKR